MDNKTKEIFEAFEDMTLKLIHDVADGGAKYDADRIQAVNECVHMILSTQFAAKAFDDRDSHGWR